ncbi:MAG TPA: HlyD family efflux transporter periplasmic adaptor subunit [Pedobacter sp.]|nr:HlyD family efflux transporter periplasmic adaptor subunit [Pedobacter sp.]
MPVYDQETVLNTHLVYLKQIGVSSQIIYGIFLLFILVAMGSLPFLNITISVKGRGLIQSTLGKSELIVPIDGRLIHLNLADNQKIKKGETIIVIDGTLPMQQIKELNSRKLQMLAQLKDAERLSLTMEVGLTTLPQDLKTEIYIAGWQLYAEQVKYAENIRHQNELAYQRHQKLYLKNIISQAELEQYKFNYEQALSEQRMVHRKYHSQWLTEANQYRNELRNINGQTAQLKEQEKQYVVKATVTGSVQNLIGIQNGAYVHANQKLGEISPDTSLLAVCYVKSSDIGLIKKDQSVRFQIDAFNYSQWGMLVGKVVDVSDDVIVLNQDSFFKVKCRLAKSYLQLKSGYKGNVKKGMALTANFAITKRSLYQLIFDKSSDWF